MISTDVHLFTFFSGLTWWKQNLVISDRAHLVFNFHQEIDAALENMKGGKKFVDVYTYN